MEYIKKYTMPCLSILTGCKTNNIAVVYTEFNNLKKTQRMEVGQVGFYSDKKVCTVESF